MIASPKKGMIQHFFSRWKSIDGKSRQLKRLKPKLFLRQFLKLSFKCLDEHCVCIASSTDHR